MSEIRLPAHLKDAAKDMTANPSSEHSLFEDSYKSLGRMTHKAVNEAEEHPVVTTAAIIVGAALLLYSTRGDSIIAGKLGSGMEKTAAEKMAAQAGERITADALGEEEKRLTLLNPALAREGPNVKAGATIKIYNQHDLTKLAEKTQFKFVPPLGQFLKENGVTEEQIGRALDIQKAQPIEQKKLLGQILSDEGLATKELVDAAQGELKKVLVEVRRLAGIL
ncbi:MAG: hypothetical protein KGS72_20240 [Cyanobacteria bacterium REEB67]|nr:hypothetical protein [Cyanobacteria bacterium REEB67]